MRGRDVDTPLSFRYCPFGANTTLFSILQPPIEAFFINHGEAK